ncbi:glycerophosphodiester phosphodiesterase domain-containing protein 4-like isoform 1-T3 [Liasis olivaceus]
MDVGHISVTNVKLWSRKSRHRRPPQIPEHQPFVICLTGFYSCQWGWQQHRTVKPGHWCCKKRECSFFAILTLALSFWFIFLSLWGGTKNDYHSFDVYSYMNIGYWFHWSIFLLVLAVFSFSYLLFLLILAVCLLCENQQLYLHWCHKTMTIFVLFLSIIGLITITLFWKGQWYTFYLSFQQISAPFLHMAAILTMILLAWPVAIHFFQMKNRVLQILIFGPYLLILLFFLFIPLGMTSPCIREKGTLGPKPGLIGHRGAPMVAPENTEMSFVKTIDYGADGLETDVTISFDGVPFLMHDKTLKRTTNIGTLFPTIRNKKASFFSWPALQLLNAGQWFFKRRPFPNMPLLSEGDEKWAKNQKIYKFSDFLTLADKANKVVIFDLYRPPLNHPYRDTFLNRTLDVLKNESGIKANLVLWLMDSGRTYVQSVAPGFQHTTSSLEPIEDLQKRNIVKLNLDYRRMATVDIRKYAEANITTNLWVVSEPWLYSLAWCYGAKSVTTNAVHTLGNISQPFFFLTPKEYRTMWIVTDSLALLFIFLIFGFHWWRKMNYFYCNADSETSVTTNPSNCLAMDLNKLPSVA